MSDSLTSYGCRLSWHFLFYHPVEEEEDQVSGAGRRTEEAPAGGRVCCTWRYRLYLFPKILGTRSISDLRVVGFGNIYMNFLSIPNLKILKPSL